MVYTWEQLEVIAEICEVVDKTVLAWAKNL